jgi:hypothetical protein
MINSGVLFYLFFRVVRGNFEENNSYETVCYFPMIGKFNFSDNLQEYYWGRVVSQTKQGDL